MRTPEMSICNGFILANELAELGVNLTPARYEVWYIHRTNADPAISHQIELFTACGAPVHNEYLDQVYTEFCKQPEIDSRFSEYVEELDRPVATVNDIAQRFSQSIATCNNGVSKGIARLNENNIDRDEIASIANFISASAEKAIATNEDLERELSTALQELSTLRHSLEETHKAANTDSLTGLYNRRYFEERFEKELQDAAGEKGASLSLILCDIDFFKRFNDKWGHQVGDKVLELTAATLSENTKGKDIVARYGGEEFVVLLPETNGEDARALAELIRKTICKKTLRKQATNELLGQITMSFGVAEFFLDCEKDTLIEIADSALYEAKRSGRNKVILAERPDTNHETALANPCIAR